MSEMLAFLSTVKNLKVFDETEAVPSELFLQQQDILLCKKLGT